MSFMIIGPLQDDNSITELFDEEGNLIGHAIEPSAATRAAVEKFLVNGIGEPGIHHWGQTTKYERSVLSDFPYGR